MLFNCENGDRGTVFDANGKEIKYAIKGDTETGECTTWNTCDGVPVVDEEKGEFLTKTVFYPPPLKVVQFSKRS